MRECELKVGSDILCHDADEDCAGITLVEPVGVK